MGGSESSANKINLCPNHHAKADRLSRANPDIARQSLIRALSPSFLPLR
jgi:hypothetical protein